MQYKLNKLAEFHSNYWKFFNVKIEHIGYLNLGVMTFVLFQEDVPNGSEALGTNGMGMMI